jgi:hypothetical protein
VVRRIGITLSLVALLVGALALPHGAAAGQASRAHHKSVAKHCKALRAEMGAKSFKRAFGKGRHKRHPLRGCVARRGVVRKVAVRSETVVSAPPSADCPPGTVPEQPKPVSAFATTPIACVAAPPPATCDQVAAFSDEDEQGEDSDEDVATEESDDGSCEQSSDDQDEDSDDDGDDSDDD